MGERNGRGLVGDIAADIRSKIIDEAWFGRRGPADKAASSLGWEMDAPEPRTTADRTALLSFEEAWATREPTDKLSPDHDLGEGIDH